MIEDILEAAQKIIKYTKGMTFESFVQDEKTIDAVVRNFEIIGEASNRLSEGFKAKNSQIDWHKMKGFRNRIVHDYFGIDYLIFWNIVENQLQKLVDAIYKNLSPKI